MCPDHLVYTGPIDAYYQYKYGKLPYRSVRFDMQHCRKGTYVQPTGTVNFPRLDVDYTRRTEFKHITGQVCPGTTVCSEYPREDGEPFYPIPNPYNEALYQTYAARAAKDSHVTFVGRLAQYRYYNMDQVVGAALTAAEKFQ
jgi:UDP-galactopyranose mutase